MKITAFIVFLLFMIISLLGAVAEDNTMDRDQWVTLFIVSVIAELLILFLL